MTVVDLHPEELLEKDALGELDDAERARLQAHVARCATCRFERQLRADFAEDLAADAPPVRFDALAATRSLRNAEPPAETPLRRSLRVSMGPPPRARVTWLLAAAAVLVGGVAAGAIGLGERRSLAPSSGTGIDAPTVATPAKRPKPLAAPVVAVPRDEVVAAPASESPAPSIEVRTEPKAQELTFASQGARAVAVVATTEPQLGPADLLEAEGGARRRGDYGRVLDLHRRLETHFGGSREAQVSRATVGRLELDRGNPASALASFDSYLRTGTGDLREEVMVGRATALERLGRSQEASDAWASLLAVFPATPYGVHARAQLGLPHGE